ncbi:MAG: polymer-forming cytoskeletal protein [Dehalococcoidia bacterium]
MFFRKKRYSDVEGYDRISRMIDDQPADGEEGDEDQLEEDTVLLTRDAQESQMSSDDASAGRETMPVTDETSVEESVTVVKAPAPQREAPPTVTPAPVPAPVPAAFAAPFEPPRMTVPDLAAVAGQGGASLVAKDAIWEGKLVCTGNVRIEGTLRGEVETDGTLFVAAEAQVDGTVRARNVTLAGEIKGDLRCEERLEILPGGAARGDVKTGALVVHEGAFIDSRFQMQREAAVR